LTKSGTETRSHQDRVLHNRMKTRANHCTPPATAYDSGDQQSCRCSYSRHQHGHDEGVQQACSVARRFIMVLISCNYLLASRSTETQPHVAQHPCCGTADWHSSMYQQDQLSLTTHKAPKIAPFPFLGSELMGMCQQWWHIGRLCWLASCPWPPCLRCSWLLCPAAVPLCRLQMHLHAFACHRSNASGAPPWQAR
jgi:hypothetical protein